MNDVVAQQPAHRRQATRLGFAGLVLLYLLIVAIALVWFAELINTAIEYVCDLVSPEHDERVKRAKDIGAGAVLICAMGAALIGVLTFWPYLRHMV